ncbi:MAG: hypothetical protein ACT6RD_10210 [Brevundimonas sp.]|uniref:hypothetical protein n=1 Tax=Brevundimonas sp. TaxID=1871086 RepID=UPI004033FB9C
MKTNEHIGSVAWLNARMTLEVLTTARTRIVDDLVSVMLLAAVSNANTSHLDARPDISQRYLAVGSVTDDLRRPAAVSSLARSLGVPRETARGKAHELVALGLIEMVPEGLILRSDALLADPIRSASQAFMESIERFIQGLARLEACGLDETWALATPTPQVQWGALRLVTANMLRSIAHVMDLSPDLGLMSAYIMLAVTQETGAHLELDAQPPPPSALGRTRRGPVRGAAVAAALSMPQETVRRHLQRLVRSGRLKVDPAGYSIQITDERLPLWRELQAQSLVNTRQLVWKLQAAGIVVKV